MLANWNAANIALTVNGIPMDGLGETDFISIESNEPAFTSVAGADGFVSRSRSNDGRHTITLTFLQNSPANFHLNAIFEADKLNPNGAGVGAFQMVDLNTQDVYFAPRAWVANRGAITRGKETNEQEWTLECDFMAIAFGPFTQL